MTGGRGAALLTRERRELLESLKRERGLGRNARAIRPRPRNPGETLPLSFAQQRIWYLCRLDPESAFYNTPIVVAMEGVLETEALRRALGEIVARHEALRTRFPLVAAEPRQVVDEPLPVRLPQVDLRAVRSDVRDHHARRWVDRAVREPFNLERGPMIRFVLLKLEPRVHWLLVLTHHLVFDGWSVSVLGRELTRLYGQFSEGGWAGLPALPIQYGDFAVWQREWLAEDVLEQQLDAAEARLAGAPPALLLPSDRVRPRVQTYRGLTKSFLLPRLLTARLVELGRGEEVTLFSVLLSVFTVLLHRVSGQDDMIVSAGVANRNRSETEALIGCFINILLLRLQPSGDLGFRQLLARAHSSILEAFEHQDLPFERVVARLKPKRDTSFSPLAQVMIVLHNTGLPNEEMGGLRLRQIEVEKGAAQYDLLLHLRHIAGQLHGVCEFNTDLFDPTTIDRWLGYFQRFAEAAVAEPEQRVGKLPCLTPAEAHALLVESNDTRTELGGSLLHELVQRQCEERPDSVAVCCGEDRWTYGQLWASAWRLARHLRSLGVGPDVVVGVCLERSPRLYQAWLGVLVAGGAYVPLDPDYPAERLELMTRESAAKMLVTEQGLADRLPADGARRVLVDVLPSDPESSGPAPDPFPRVDPEDLAYVIFTSGSTGQPKGIAVRHRGVVNNLLDLDGGLQVSASDRGLALSATSFDMSVFECFGLLAAGGTVVIPWSEAVRDVGRWAELVERHRITVWNSAPPMLELLVETFERRPGRDLSSLRLAILGGDWIPLSLPDRLAALTGGVDFIALGGATEASIHSTIYRVRSTDPAWRSIPYGRPMANQETYLLSGACMAVPYGVAGELFLGGRGLARGYLRQPARTAERFVPKPHGRGERIYRTGDLVRWGTDGQLELLGRVDWQVKLRGMRIETGEISAALKRHPSVREAVVLLHNDRTGPRLVAYMVGPEDGESEELKHHLRATLPDYMVPSTLVFLERMPLSPNGKVLRSALKPPTDSESASTSSEAEPVVAPETDAEVRLHAAFSRILGLDEICVTQDFFDQGGDSFQAMRIVQELSGELSVVDLLRNPTIRGLAHILEGRREDRDTLVQWFDGPGSGADLMVCVPYGGGTAIVYRDLAEHLAGVRAVGALALPGREGTAQEQGQLAIDEAAAAACDEIIGAAPRRITVYGHCAGVALAVELALRLEERGADVDTVFLGAGLPWARPWAVRWLARLLGRERFRDDRSVLKFIDELGVFRGAGGPADESDRWRFLVEGFRHDARCAEEYFAAAGRRPARRLNAPIVCFLGEEDPLTRGSARRAEAWSQFGDSVEVVTVPGGDHYFVRDRAAELGEMIRARLAGDPAGGPSGPEEAS